DRSHLTPHLAGRVGNASVTRGRPIDDSGTSLAATNRRQKSACPAGSRPVPFLERTRTVVARDGRPHDQRHCGDYPLALLLSESLEHALAPQSAVRPDSAERHAVHPLAELIDTRAGV